MPLYFKITNANENHNGYQYVNGLNVLDRLFEETGTCVKGGLYFSDAKNILKFLSYGIYLREIALPESDPDFKMVKDPSGDKWRANKIIFGKRYNLSDVSTFELLVSLGADLKENNNYEISHAAAHGHLEVVKYLFKNGIRNYWALQTACEKGHLEIVKFLIEKGEDHRFCEDFALRNAAMHNHLKIVEFLVEKGANVAADDNYAIQHASIRGHLEIVEFLVKKGANIEAVNMWEVYKKSRVEIIKYLMKMGKKCYFKVTNAEENHNGFQYVSGLNVLEEPFEETGSCVKGGLYFADATNIFKFLDYGIYLREITLPHTHTDFKMVEDPSGNKFRANKLILGTRHDLSDITTLEYLVALGATLDNDVMNHACKHGNLPMVKYLIDKGIDINALTGCALGIAAENGHLLIVDYLIKQGAVCGVQSDYAIKFASLNGHLEVVKYLIKNGANHRADNDAAIGLASTNGHLDVVKYLVKKGADFKADSEYALRMASQFGKLEVVKYLVGRGADFKIYDSSAVKWARAKGYTEVVDFLEECENERYFKITNENENHNGFQYVDGLNVLKEPFVEEGSCVGGGLYFTNVKNIFNFLAFGIHLREVILPRSDANFKMVLDPEGDKWRANKIILGDKRSLSDFSTFKYLVSLGAELNNSAINSAFFHGYFLDAFQYMIDEKIDFRPYAYTILKIACENNYLEVIDHFVKIGVSFGTGDINILDWTLMQNYLKIFMYLVEKGVDSKTNCDSALRVAIENNYVNVVKYLVEKGADFMKFEDLLSSAFKNNQMEIVNFLIRKGADLTKNKTKESIINRASKKGGLGIVEYMVETGGKLTTSNNYAIRFAARNGHLEVVKYLTEKGADISACENYAVRFAARNGHLEIVKYLTEKGADPTDCDNYALEWATNKNFPDVVAFINGIHQKIE